MPIDLRNSIVSQYKMDETSGTTVVDSSGNGYNGTAQRDCSLLTVPGKIGTALSFNGTSDYIDTGQNFQTVFRDSFSVNFWINPNVLPPIIDVGLFNTDESSNWVECYTQFNGRLYVLYSVPSHEAQVSSIDVVLSTGQWFMVTVVFEKVTSSTMRGAIFINTDKPAQNSYSDGYQVINGIMNMNMAGYTSTQNPHLGCFYNNGVNSSFLDGSLDDVMIFNKALSTAEIAFLYNNGNGTQNLFESGVIMDDYFADQWAW
jgi:hypothetical protein